jgi:hypothetical protein
VERDLLDAVGDYKSPAGMSAENIRMCQRLCGEECVEKNKRVAGQCAVKFKTETFVGHKN